MEDTWSLLGVPEKHSAHVRWLVSPSDLAILNTCFQAGSSNPHLGAKRFYRSYMQSWTLGIQG